MNTFPMTKIGGIEVSRVTCGTNTFYGFSHFSAARDRWLRQHFTAERIMEVLEACRLEGINVTISSPNEGYYQILREHERQTGHHWVWMCTPGGKMWEEVVPGVKWCADHGVEICLPHQCYTDNNLIPAEKRIAGGPELLQAIRDHGMIPGWSTHRPETIIVCDEAAYDVETYILPYNSIGFLCPVETDWTGRVIRDTPKPVICIKPLGAGRIMPPTGFSFVFGSNKPIDTVAIGFLSPDEAKEDIGIARDLIERREREIELQYTRSKSALVRGKAAAPATA
jgi:hypothetical protein